MNKAMQLIDVRTPAEYKEEHADGAINLPVEEISKGKFPDCAKEEQLYLYCRSGGRSGLAVSLLKAEGYVNAQNVGSLAQAQTFVKNNSDK